MWLPISVRYFLQVVVFFNTPFPYFRYFGQIGVSLRWNVSKCLQNFQIICRIVISKICNIFAIKVLKIQLNEFVDFKIYFKMYFYLQNMYRCSRKRFGNRLATCCQCLLFFFFVTCWPSFFSQQSSRQEIAPLPRARELVSPSGKTRVPDGLLRLARDWPAAFSFPRKK